MLSFHSALCPDSDIAPLYPTPKCLGMKYAGLKIFIHFIQTTAKKRGGKNAVLGPGVAGFFPLGHSSCFWEQKVWGWCQILPGQGMRVISVVSLSLMPFSSDPNILVWHSTFISIHGFADNATDFVFFPRRFLTLHPQKCSIFKSCYRDRFPNYAQIMSQWNFTFFNSWFKMLWLCYCIILSCGWRS